MQAAVAASQATCPMTALRRFLAEIRLPLFRNASALLLSSVLTSGLGIVYWALAARLYPARDIGLGASLVSAMMFVAGVSQLNLRSVLYRYVPRAGRRARKLVAGSYLFVTASSIGLGTIAALLGIQLGAAPVETAAAGLVEVSAFVMSTAIWSVFAFQDSVLASLRLTVWVPIENGAFAILKLAILFAFVSLHPFGVFLSWLLPALLGVFVISGLIFAYVLPRISDPPEIEPLKIAGIVRYVAADYVAGIFSTAATDLMPVLVYLLLGPIQNAYFYPVWLIATMLRLLPVAMYSSLMVESAAGNADFHRDGRRTIVWIALGLAGPIAVLVVGAQMVLLVFGPDYAAAGALPMRLLALSTVPYTINNFAAYLARSRAQMRRVVLIEAGVSVPSLALTVALLPPFGLTGVALALLISQLLVASVLMVTVMRSVIRVWLH